MLKWNVIRGLFFLFYPKHTHPASASVILRTVYYQNSWRQYEETATLIGNFIVQTSCCLFSERTTSFVRQLLVEIDFFSSSFSSFILSLHLVEIDFFLFLQRRRCSEHHVLSNSLHQFSMITFKIDSDKVLQNSLNY